METIHTPAPQRPGFLTVLCVLTFIYSGLNIMSNFFGLIFSSVSRGLDLSPFVEDALTEIDEAFARQLVESALEVAQKAIDHGMTMAISNLLLYGLNLLGAIMMFKLKKMGFYLYLAAQILLLLVAPMFLGWNFITAFGILFNGMFTVLFVILYGLNLKHMR